MRFVLIISIISMAVMAGLGMLWLSGGADTVTNGPIAAVQPTGGDAGDVATVDVLVARKNISLGDVVTESMVDSQPWPKHLVLENFIPAESQQIPVVGMVARADFRAREPLSYAKLTSAKDASFLASTLGKGMRAITVSVDSVSGIAGYVLAGDRVDILFTHSADAAQLRSNSAAVSEVMLSNVKVLAVNTRGYTSADAAGRAMRSEPPTNVTLEMSLQDAKKLRLAENIGTISLVLRSLDDQVNENVGLPVTVDHLSDAHTQKNENKDWSVEEFTPTIGPGNDEVIIIRGVVEERPKSAAPVSPAGLGMNILGAAFGR